MTEINKKLLDDCAKCGSCKARCPVYDITRNEGFSPRGRIVLLKGIFSGGTVQAGPPAIRRLMSCALCGLCDNTCPVGIKPTEIIYQGRAALRGADRGRLLLRTALRFGLRSPGAALGAARIFPGLAQRVLPGVKTLPRHTLRNGGQVIKPANRKSAGRVAVFAGCSTNYLMPDTGESLIGMLLALGYEVILPHGEVCCGSPLRALGLEEEARNFALKNIEVFGKMNVEAVVSPCPTCTLVIREHYRHLTGAAVRNAMDAVEFLSGKLDAGAGRKTASERLVWHEPCHLRHGLGFDPQGLLNLLNIEKGDDGCCGLGLSLTDRGLSQEMLRRKTEAYQGRGRVVTACPGCMLQLRRGGLETVHILELMEEAFFPAAEV